MLSVFRLARKSLGRTVIALSALALAACEPVALSGTGPGASRGGPVPVALLVPAGSGQANDEALAKSLENAARLAIADLGPGAVDLRVYRTAGQPSRAAVEAARAVDEGAQVILGPVFAAEANAAGVAVAQRGVNVLSFSNNTDIAGGNVFVLGQTFRNTASRLAQYAVRNNAGQIMVVYDQNAAGNTGRTAIEAGVRQAGGTVVGAQGYEFSQNGITQAAPRIAQAARDASANAVFLTAGSDGALPLVSQLLRENGLTNERFIGLTRWDIPAATLSLPGVQGGWFAQPDPGLYGQYVARYQGAYGVAPHPISGLAYDGIAAIGALAKRGDAPTAQALTQGSGFAGVGGVFRLLADGSNERGLAVAQITNNQVTVIDPAPRSFGGAGF
ncbi:penicillin-binding protein activator [Falsirhodobacter xinxiangensis]|uniref:penicillin-binding protein activator n=1 Tax=Falsirhodobacter xinxiangensis TaxID=2530049 RepID=UPI0010AAB069|nr:penicillin-binding protein activator [Rhodobacter xinxiangensis]